MITSGLLTSDSSMWETPQEFFKSVQEEFNLNLDVCATRENAKLPKYYDAKANGLKSTWGGYRVYCNPPYGREISKWVKRAYESDAEIVVMLLPARTDTRWFHEYIYGKAEIRFIRGRLHFSNSKNSAPFPSMLVIYRKEQ